MLTPEKIEECGHTKQWIGISDGSSVYAWRCPDCGLERPKNAFTRGKWRVDSANERNATSSLASASAGDGELIARLRDANAFLVQVETTDADDLRCDNAAQAVTDALDRLRSLAGEVAELRRGRRDEELKEDARLGAALARAESLERDLRAALERVGVLEDHIDNLTEICGEGTEDLPDTADAQIVTSRSIIYMQLGDFRRARATLEGRDG